MAPGMACSTGAALARRCVTVGDNGAVVERTNVGCCPTARNAPTALEAETGEPGEPKGDIPDGAKVENEERGEQSTLDLQLT